MVERSFKLNTQYKLVRSRRGNTSSLSQHGGAAYFTDYSDREHMKAAVTGPPASTYFFIGGKHTMSVLFYRPSVAK